MKHEHGFLLKYLVLICAVLLGAPVSAHAQTLHESAQDANASAQHQDEVHSRLFRGQTIETIPELLSKTSGDLHLEYDQPPGFPTAPEKAPAYPPYALVALACTSDTVIVATAQSGVSHITSDQKFIYTDWSLSIERILKASSEPAVSPGSTIIVTRAGGTLQVNGRKIVATDEGFKDFKAGGRYLLFLEFIPETGAYKATAEKSFFIQTNIASSLAKNNPFGYEPKSADVLLQDTTAAVTAQIPGCSGRVQ